MEMETSFSASAFSAADHSWNFWSTSGFFSVSTEHKGTKWLIPRHWGTEALTVSDWSVPLALVHFQLWL